MGLARPVSPRSCEVGLSQEDSTKKTVAARRWRAYWRQRAFSLAPEKGHWLFNSGTRGLAAAGLSTSCSRRLAPQTCSCCRAPPSGGASSPFSPAGAGVAAPSAPGPRAKNREGKAGPDSNRRTAKSQAFVSWWRLVHMGMSKRPNRRPNKTYLFGK